MKVINTKWKTFLCLLLVITEILLASCSDSVQANNSSKELKVSYLGFNTTKSNYFVPGEKVQILARANKKDVSYSWTLPGEWTKVNDNRVCWMVPEQEGSYTLAVTVTDEQLNKSACKSIDILVSDNTVCAVPESMSCKVTTTISMNNRLFGENFQTTVSTINMNSDNSVLIETIESNGEITRTFTDTNSVYRIDNDGNRTLLAEKRSEKSQVPKVNVFGLSSLINSCSNYETDGRFFKFRQENSTQKAFVDYDSKLGVVTRIHTENEEDMEVNDIQMEYDVIEGYIIPKKVSGIVTFYASGEKFITKIEETITDVIINENGGE